MWWYDGSERPPDSIVARVDGKLPDQGTVFVGTDGALLLPHGGNEPLLYPQGKFTSRASWPTLEPRDHYGEFLDAVLANGKCSASFDYAGPLSESVLLGNVAAWYPGEKLELDGRALRITNKSEANAKLPRTYCKGWPGVKELSK